MTSSRTRRVTSAVAVATMTATGLAFASGTSSAANSGPTIPIQLLSFNDFHGNLEPPAGSGGRVVVDHFVDTADSDGDGNRTEVLDRTVDAGGAEYLATKLAELRKGHPYSLTVAAGDIVGASPLLSAAFHDEPTIEAMNAVGLDATSVGNHEFDEGYEELQRLDSGGCLDDGDGAQNQNSCPDGSFAGADFPFLAANVKHEGTDETILPPYWVKNIKGAKIGFIGMTLEDTPNIVTAAGVEGLDFTDEVETANALVPVLKAQGVNAVVVLIHEGGFPESRQTWTDPATGTTHSVNADYDFTCEKGGVLSGPITDIAGALDPAIDLVVSGHTHAPYICSIQDPAGQQRMVTSASSFGRLVTETTFDYDRRASDIVRASVASTNVIVDRTTRAPGLTSLIDQYRTLVAPIANRVLGTITADVGRSNAENPGSVNAAGESQLGDLIADAQLADPSTVTGGQVPQIAFMNPGGIRAPLNYAQSKGEGDGVVTYEEAFTTQPFNNYLVSLTLTGAQLKEVLREQWGGGTKPSPNTVARPVILQVSEGFAYSFTDVGGTRTLGPVTLDGVPISDTAEYRVVTNNFVADGGDGLPGFRDGTGKFFGGLDIDAFADHLEANSPYTPGPLTRITKN
jgi:2',3'-cyclic-nucleotide 2'-phosphodiesterase (5'-nucleotidase family)